MYIYTAYIYPDTYTHIMHHTHAHKLIHPLLYYTLYSHTIHLLTYLLIHHIYTICAYIAISAYDLKKAFPAAELVYTLSGHSGYEPDNIRELVAATERFKHR